MEKQIIIYKRNLFKFFLLFNLIMLPQYIKSQNETNDDPERVLKETFLYNESVYQHQQFKFPRSSWKNQCTLDYQLKSILGDITFSDAWISCTSMNGIEELKFINIEDILSIDPLLLSFNITDSGTVQRKYFEPNIAIYLGFIDQTGHKQYVAVHTSVRGLMNITLYTRVSIMITNSLPTDDLISYKSNFNPIVFSYLNVFDINPDEYMTFYKSIESSTLNKLNNNEELNNYENSIWKGINEEESISYNFGYGEWLYTQNRYYDSYIILKNVYEILKGNLNNDTYNTDNEFYEVCYYRGMSMAKNGHHDMAYYLLDLASYGNSNYKNDFENLKSNIIADNNDKTYKLGYIEIGDVMETLFEMNNENLQSAIISDGNIVKTLESPDEIWNTNLYNLCKENSVMMTLKYTRSSISTNNIDKSQLGFENNVLIIVNKIPVNDKKLWRINIMIPNFKNIDYKFNNSKINIPENISFIVGMDEKSKENLGIENLDDILIHAIQLHSEKRYFESMLAFKTIFYNTKLNDDKHSMAGYSIGYILNEFGKEEKSIFYLSQVNNNNITHYSEFITTLCNVKDPRAYDLVVNEIDRMNKVEDKDIKTSDYYKNYCMFLQRRYAYLLIERKEYDKAKIILKEMLNNPESKSFAEQELEYINEIEKK